MQAQGEELDLEKKILNAYDDPFQKQLRMRQQSQISEFLLDLMSKRLFTEMEVHPLDTEFNHPLEFKKQYLPAFYRETSA